MILDQIVVTVAGAESRARDRIVASLAAAGATVDACTEATAVARAAAGLDAMVVVAGDDPEALVPLASAVRSDPVSRNVPRIVIVDGSVAVERLAAFGISVAAAAEMFGELARR